MWTSKYQHKTAYVIHVTISLNYRYPMCSNLTTNLIMITSAVIPLSRIRTNMFISYIYNYQYNQGSTVSAIDCYIVQACELSWHKTCLNLKQRANLHRPAWTDTDRWLAGCGVPEQTGRAGPAMPAVWVWQGSSQWRLNVLKLLWKIYLKTIWRTMCIWQGTETLWNTIPQLCTVRGSRLHLSNNLPITHNQATKGNMQKL